MNTPDAGRIRVRWYRVPDPPPGSYDLTDFSSSNFDADTLSYDPPAGEESTSRDPFKDWRDCCSPPFLGYENSLCTLAVTPCFLQYRVSRFQVQSLSSGVLAFPGAVASWTADCLWTTGPVAVPPATITVRRGAVIDGLLEWIVQVRRPFFPLEVAAYLPSGPVDMTGPFNVFYRPDLSAMPWAPAYLTLTPVEPDAVGTDRCTGIGTSAGDFLAVTS